MAAQEVSHVHLHIFARFEHDGSGARFGPTIVTAQAGHWIGLRRYSHSIAK
ncbi:MAG: hypothetical protein JO121_06550 [Deltaproteobacteria bacterium]|nr:hypothetical protein [Deltaproteobacteria bacterium]